MQCATSVSQVVRHRRCAEPCLSLRHFLMKNRSVYQDRLGTNIKQYGPKGAFAQNLADFVEYLYGGANTHWGSVRVADGHPAPYPAVAIEISNEACMTSFNGARMPPSHVLSHVFSRSRHPHVHAHAHAHAHLPQVHSRLRSQRWSRRRGSTGWRNGCVTSQAPT